MLLYEGFCLYMTSFNVSVMDVFHDCKINVHSIGTETNFVSIDDFKARLGPMTNLEDMSDTNEICRFNTEGYCFCFLHGNICINM